MPAAKPQSVVTEVIARKVAGQYNSQIARDLKIARSTVATILDSSGFSQAIEYGQVRVHRMIPKTCDALERAIDGDKLPAILAVLNGTGILKPESDEKEQDVSVTINVVLPTPQSEVR